MSPPTYELCDFGVTWRLYSAIYSPVKGNDIGSTYPWVTYKKNFIVENFKIY